MPLINFEALLSQSAKLRLEHHRDRVAAFTGLSNAELARTAEYYLKHSVDGRIGVEAEIGTPSYDAILVDALLPELIKRLKQTTDENMP